MTSRDTVAPQASRLTYATIAGSLMVSPLLLAAHFVFHSQLALAQAADSLSDTLGGAALAWAVHTSARSADEDHPHGHARAEPIAALVVAVLIGMLSIEVLRTAVTALLSSERPALDWPVAGAFAVKIVFKSTVAALARRMRRAKANPALEALEADAKSDVLVCSLSVVGFLLARVGWPSVDAALAVLIAVYIAASGLRLGRDNVVLLMGTSAPPERLAELRALVASSPGVERVGPLVATFYGTSLHVHCDVDVASELSLIDAHAIGHGVEARIAGEPDVARAVVHVGPAERPPRPAVSG